MKDILKNNTKFIIILLFIIILGFVGITFAFNYSSDPVLVDIDTANIDVDVTFDDSVDGAISSSELFPIDESPIDNYTKGSTLDSSIIKSSFTVSAPINNNNPSNVIYDIVLDDINMSCELKNQNMKWLLLKYDEDESEYITINSGNFSPSFDTMPNNKLYLTNNQEDLEEEAEYVLLIWLKETCNEEITQCFDYNQDDFMNRHLSANVKLEIATAPRGSASKILRQRITSSSSACNYKKITQKPVCTSNLIYDGTSKNLITNIIDVGVKYTMNTYAGINAGTYNLVAKPITTPFIENSVNYDGYDWEVNSGEDYSFTCIISKREIFITTNDQYSNEFTTNINNAVTVTNLPTNHHIHSLEVYKTNTITNAYTLISAANAVIYDENDNDVTNNYIINYANIGQLMSS